MRSSGDRRWTVVVVGSMTALVAAVLGAVLVVDPVQTVSPDLAALYRGLGPRGWVGLAPVLLVWLVPVVVLTVLAVLVGRLDAAGPVDRWAVRATSLAFALGLPATVSVVVPGFPVGLAFFVAAEELGIAPPSGSTSPLVLAIGGTGVVLLTLAVVGTAVLAVRTWTRTRRLVVAERASEGRGTIG